MCYDVLTVAVSTWARLPVPSQAVTWAASRQPTNLPIAGLDSSNGCHRKPHLTLPPKSPFFGRKNINLFTGII
jgi:hypothetical protein